MKRPKNPVVRGRMYKVSGGGAVRGIRFNQNGTTDVLVVPGQKKRNPPKKKKARKKRKNESYRKTKKKVRKLQRAGMLERGPMFQKWRKATKISKTGRKKNARRVKERVTMKRTHRGPTGLWRYRVTVKSGSRVIQGFPDLSREEAIRAQAQLRRRRAQYIREGR